MSIYGGYVCLNLPRKLYGARKGVGIFLCLHLTFTPSPTSLWSGPSPTVSHCYGSKFCSRIQLPSQFLSYCSLLIDLPVWLSLVYLLCITHFVVLFPLLSFLVIFVSIIHPWTPNIPVPHLLNIAKRAKLTWENDKNRFIHRFSIKNNFFLYETIFYQSSWSIDQRLA